MLASPASWTHKQPTQGGYAWQVMRAAIVLSRWAEFIALRPDELSFSQIVQYAPHR